MTVKEQIEQFQQRLGNLGDTMKSTASSAGHAVATATTRKHVSSEEVMTLESDYSAHKYVASALTPATTRCLSCSTVRTARAFGTPRATSTSTSSRRTPR